MRDWRTSTLILTTVLALVLGAVILPGCAALENPVKTLIEYPVIQKPLFEADEMIFPDGSYSSTMRAVAWERNTYAVLRWAERLEARVDAYNEFAKAENLRAGDTTSASVGTAYTAAKATPAVVKVYDPAEEAKRAAEAAIAAEFEAPIVVTECDQ